MNKNYLKNIKKEIGDSDSFGTVSNGSITTFIKSNNYIRFSISNKTSIMLVGFKVYD